MKFYRSLFPYVFAILFLASCFDLGSCISFTGCEINLGATVEEISEQPAGDAGDTVGAAIRQVIDERL